MGKGEITRRRIIELAAPLFNQRGYAGCSMQDVMEATGLKKGGLYRHFASKEELAAEAFRYSLGRATKIRTDHLDPSLGAVERLQEVIEQFIEKPSPVPGGCPILNTAIDSDDGNPVLRNMVREGLRQWRSRIEKIAREGVSTDEIRGDVEPRALANTIIATLEGALMIARLEGSRTALNDAKGSLVNLLRDAAVKRV
jgi:TetR/AcrR family transcriptional regulator, transcriptional repressor for nem operon